MRVRPGPEGLATFKAHLKAHLGITIGPEFDVTFECQMPATGSLVTLSGLNAYGAATHCAALLAASKVGAGAAGGGSLRPCSSAAAAPGPAPATAASPRGLAAPQQPVGGAALPAASSSRACDAPSRRRACQTGYLYTPPLPSEPAGSSPWARQQPAATSSSAATGAGAGAVERTSRTSPHPTAAAASSRPHTSWRHLYQGTDLELRRARLRCSRRIGAATSAPGLVLYGSGGDGGEADDDESDELLDELPANDPVEPLSEDEDGDGRLYQTTSAPASPWTRRLEAAAGAQSRPRRASTTRGSGPFAATGVAAAAAVPTTDIGFQLSSRAVSGRRARPASNGYMPSAPLRPSAFADGAVPAPWSSLVPTPPPAAAAAPEQISRLTAPPAAVRPMSGGSGCGTPPQGTGAAACVALPLVEVERPLTAAAAAAAGEAARQLQRAEGGSGRRGERSSPSGGMQVAGAAQACPAAAASGQPGGGALMGTAVGGMARRALRGGGARSGHEALEAGGRLPSLLRAAAKRTMGSLLRALRHRRE